MITSISRLDDLEEYTDHFRIQIEISGTSREPQKKQEVNYSYCNCDFDYLNELIANNPFDPYCYSSIEKNTDLWYKWIFHLIDKTTPRRARRKQELPPWVSSETSHKLNKFRTLRRKSDGCVNFSPYLATQLIELENPCANLQERERQEYEEELISSRNRSRIFKYLKSFQKEKCPPKIVHLDWNSVAQNHKEKAELFNTYFSLVVTDESYEQIDAPPLLEAGGQKINFTEKEIANELEMLVVTKSRVSDGIPPILLKKTAKTVSKSIKSLFNNIGRLHSVSGSWKHGLVSPIFKDVNKSEVKNYRPVTLLNIISKVFENLVLKFFSEHLLNSFTSCQFGFLPRRSVILQLILSLSKIFENLSASEEFCFLLLFDFSKAFDKTKHSVLKKSARMYIP